jgi:uncharacterized protein YdeI (YjbR/CyaY-like superfamily)
MSDEHKNGITTFYAVDQAAWREWLAANHDRLEKVWLIIYNKGSGVPSVNYSESVDEALCFGWIDSVANKRDGHSRYQFYSRRKPKSVWSKVNKAKVALMIAQGKMVPAGQRMIDIAKENGMWTHLDQIEEGIMPDDLVAAFSSDPAARSKFEAFPPSAKKGIFQWIISAKGVETRAKRISETVEKAALGQRANEWKPKQA